MKEFEGSAKVDAKDLDDNKNPKPKLPRLLIDFNIQGQEYLKQNAFDRAISSLKKAILVLGGDPSYVSSDQEILDISIDRLTRLMLDNAEPKNASTLLQNLGVAFLKRGTAVYSWDLFLHEKINVSRDDPQSKEHLEAAKELLEMALTLKQKHDKLHKDDPISEVSYSHLYHHMGILYRELGAFTKSITLFKQALEIQDRELDPDSIHIAETLNNMGISFHMRIMRSKELCSVISDRFNAARSANQNVLTSFDDRKEGEGFEDIDEDVSQGESCFTQALAIVTENVTAPVSTILLILENVASFYYIHQSFTEAEIFFNDLLSLQEEELGSDHPNLVSTLRNLSQISVHLKSSDNAIGYLERALSIAKGNMMSPGEIYMIESQLQRAKGGE